MNYITMYEGFQPTNTEMELNVVLTAIKDGIYKAQVDAIRTSYAQGDTKSADAMKKRLPAFTPSGVFSGGRREENLQTYTSIIVLDFDKVPETQLSDLVQKVQADPHTYSSFISPRGQGLKVLVKVDGNQKCHTESFLAVTEYYENITGVEVDATGKDITRLCFVSFDPELFLNPSPEIFKTNVWESAAKLKNETPDAQRIRFEEMVTFTKNKEPFQEGNRNNFIYQLASNCNRAGLPVEVAAQFIKETYDLDHAEMDKTIESAYKNHVEEFGIYADSAEFAGGNTSPDMNRQNWYATPYIGESVYDNLPDLLKLAVAHFTDRRERDIFFSGVLNIFSCLFPTVAGIYDNRRVNANLYSFVVAPPASGKGVLYFAKAMGDCVDSWIREQEPSLAIEGQRGQVNPSLFISANSSAAAVIRQLKANGENGVIFEYEADSLSNTLKQDWGGYSDLMRKAFHHESISISRINRDVGNINISRPCLSILLSGTNNQVPKLIGTHEDGLFSRFNFYVFKKDLNWKDVSPKKDKPILDDEFKTLCAQVMNLSVLSRKRCYSFELQEAHWGKINSYFGFRLKEITQLFHEEASSIVMRSGLILFRTAMILATIRHLGEGGTEGVIVCSDTDFETALSLAEVNISHALFMFSSLPSKPSDIGNDLQRFYELLPKNEVFTRKNAVDIGKKIGKSERTIADYLKKLLQKRMIEQVKYGYYQKVLQDHPANSARSAE